MKENNTTDTSPEPETQGQTKGKKGTRRRIYAIAEEYEEANRERTKARNRAKTEFMKKLREEGRWGQIELIKLLGKNVYDPKYIDYIYKEAGKHEKKE